MDIGGSVEKFQRRQEWENEMTLRQVQAIERIAGHLSEVAMNSSRIAQSLRELALWVDRR